MVAMLTFAHRNFVLQFRYIKEYDGGILMECKIDPKLPYTDLSTMIHRQRQVKRIQNFLGQGGGKNGLIPYLFSCSLSYN